MNEIKIICNTAGISKEAIQIAVFFQISTKK